MSFKRGEVIVLTEVWRGQVYSVRPVRVVQDSPEMLALFIAAGTRGKRSNHENNHITPRDRLGGNWALTDGDWNDYDVLRLTLPDSCASVLLFREILLNTIDRWYINLEDPLRRTEYGFEEHDMMLDVVASPDLSDWHWKDEDELAEAVDLGLVTPEKADSLYSEGRRVLSALQSGRSPYNQWVKWRPDPSWTVPELPVGWDTARDGS